MADDGLEIVGLGLYWNELTVGQRFRTINRTITLVDLLEEVSVAPSRFVIGSDYQLVPATPLGCLALIKSVRVDLKGLEALIVGRSNLVGKPVAQLLLAQHCTVTTAHSRTQDLDAGCRRAFIWIAAVGPNPLGRVLPRAGAIPSKSSTIRG